MTETGVLVLELECGHDAAVPIEQEEWILLTQPGEMWECSECGVEHKIEERGYRAHGSR